MNDVIAIIVGRSITDYIMCGHKIPEGSWSLPCCVCGTIIALGEAGQNQMGKSSQSFLFCTPCIKQMASKGSIEAADDILISSDLRKQMDRNPEVAKKMNSLLKQVGRK
jgi:hypothetical protein